jgi:hypothetical protein
MVLAMSLDDIPKDGLAKCRELPPGQRPIEFACVMNARSNADIARCLHLDDEIERVVPNEVRYVFRAVLFAADDDLTKSGAFRTAESARTPSIPCCAQPSKFCAPDSLTGDAWRRFDITMPLEFRFQYSLHAEPQRIVVEASGAESCDADAGRFGRKATYKQEIAIEGRALSHFTSRRFD